MAPIPPETTSRVAESELARRFFAPTQNMSKNKAIQEGVLKS
jgi:hypothetical protein